MATTLRHEPDWVSLLKTLLLSRAMDRKEEMQWVPEKKVHYQFSAGGHEMAQILLGQRLDHPFDAVSAYYRSRPMMLTLGVAPEDAMAGPVGKSGSYSDGRDIGVVCNHPGRMTRVRNGKEEGRARSVRAMVEGLDRTGPYVLPMAGDVGSQYTPGTGWAQSILYRHKVLGESAAKGAISVIMGGEASVATNGFWSALTMATTLQLPVLFFIEDNGYGISVPGGFQTPGGNIVDNLYSFQGIQLLDGNGSDPDESADLIRQAVEHVRRWKGPALLRLEVPRLNGHSYQDNQAYKSAERIESERQRDPLSALKAKMVPDVISESEWIRMEMKASAEVERIAVKVLERPEPDPGRIREFVFADADGRSSGERALVGGLGPWGYHHPEPVHEHEGEGGRITLVEAVRKTLEYELEINPRLVVFGEDVGVKGGVHAATMGLQTRFGPDRVFDTSLSEEGIVGRAVGMAYAGLKPVVELQFRKYADPATEQLKNAGTLRWRTRNRFAAPIVVRVPGGFAKCGDPWHSESGEGFFTHATGWQVAVPSTARDAVGLLRAAMRSENPTLFFEHRHLLDAKSARMPYPGDGFVLPFGVARRVREGSRLTVVTWGAMVERCEEAAEGSLAEGRSAAPADIEILDLRTLSPWDRDAVLASVRKTSRCLIVHEDGRTNGFGAEIAAVVTEEAFHSLDAPVRRVASPDIPIPYNVGLMEAVVPGVESIRRAITEMLAL